MKDAELKFKAENLKVSYPCRMCGSEGNRKLAEITFSDAELKLELLKCDTCSTLYYAGDDPVYGYEAEGEIDETWIHYAQFGAGISEMLDPLAALGKRAKGNLLDIGCGFGFSVDFWNKMGYGSAVGLEKAIYGKIGKELLGAPIHLEYYQESEAVRNNHYDLVYSSEVLEHIKYPKDFILEISKALTPEGILVLTTPSVDALNEKYTSADMIAALSPTYHFFLSSKEALENLLRKTGFEHIEVRNLGHRLLAWASKAPLPEIKLEGINKIDYRDYLKKLAGNQNIHISSGALFRLLKYYWESEMYLEGSEVFKELEIQSQENFGLSLKYPDVMRYDKRTSSEENIQSNPAWYGLAVLFGGLLLGQIEHDYHGKVRMIDAASCILKKEATDLRFRRFAQAAQYYYPFSLKMLTLANLESARHDLTKEDFNSLSGWYRDSLEYSLIKLIVNWCEKIGTQRFVEKLLHGKILRIKSDIQWWQKNWQTRTFIK